MDSDKFIALCEKEMADYFDEHYNLEQSGYCPQLVWFCKTVQNWKAIYVVKMPHNPYNSFKDFVECTYNGDADELYLDFYRKVFKHTCGNVSNAMEDLDA